MTRTTTKKEEATKFVFVNKAKNDIVLEFDGNNEFCCEACGSDQEVYSFKKFTDDSDDYIFLCKKCIKGIASLVK